MAKGDWEGLNGRNHSRSEWCRCGIKLVKTMKDIDYPYSCEKCVRKLRNIKPQNKAATLKDESLYSSSGVSSRKMKSDKEKIHKQTCKRCDIDGKPFTWTSMLEKPRVCPKCKSYDWNKDRKEQRK